MEQKLLRVIIQGNTVVKPRLGYTCGFKSFFHL